MYKVFFENRSKKELSKISKTDAKRVSERLRLLDYPFPLNFDISKMSGEIDYFRLRVGSVRILLKIDRQNESIIIRKIKYRGQVYKN